MCLLGLQGRVLCVTSYNLSVLLVNRILQVCNLRLQRVKGGLPLVSHLQSGAGSRGFLRAGGAARESRRTGVVCVDDVYCMSLVVLLDAYEGVVAEDGGFGSELQVKLVGNCSDEIVYRLVDLVGGRVRRGRAREGVKLVKLECCLLSVASPSVELAGAGNGGNVRRVR